MTKVTQAHVDARAAAIRKAAGFVFARRGVEAATMQEIAAAAGLSTGAIYRYFPGKEDLMAATFEEARETTRRVFETAAVASSSPLEVLIEVGKRSMDELLKVDGACLDMEMTLAGARTGGRVRQLTSDFRLAVTDMIESLVVAAQQAGEVDPALDPRCLSIILNAYVLGMSTLSLQIGEEIDVAATLDLFAGLLRRKAQPGE